MKPHKHLHQTHYHSESSKDYKSHGMQQANFIPDNFNSLDQVISALRESGLESSNLILGIDFTKSNEWTGKHSFNRRSLHAIGDRPTPYEQAISIIGHTLSPFDEDNLIPCYGFGDASTRDHSVFSFYPDNHPCCGFEEVLSRYRKIVSHLNLSDNCSVMAWLLNSMEESVTTNVMFVETAKEMWDALRGMYSNDKNISRVFELYEKLFSLR
ncbi:hypothetical protein ZIOFF_028201 [Zingiber officinale]|uniref:Copine C-terminal domain-containing protein n=1 Tax=Zingiber officinale TaxID=94328 RepID=A0A8J5LDN1_ZINOF|nr:hypothetical protein ZIOFF_028201 [Zingiber officinale]